jgi:hypothetical protein
MPPDSEIKELTAMLATLGAQLQATNQRLDTLSDQVDEIRRMLSDRDGLLTRVDRLEVAQRALESLPERVADLEHWRFQQIEQHREFKAASNSLKERLFYPLVVALTLALLSLLWALLTHQAVIGAVPAPAVQGASYLLGIVRIADPTILFPEERGR